MGVGGEGGEEEREEEREEKRREKRRGEEEGDMLCSNSLFKMWIGFSGHI